ncbi:hypothetical protein BD626DRAFT_79591 [Schizophyllum amplum]|uniref:Uncharacterized protein n=1 Tax=Schizophyllum amplum TaxID=97359 RepID=A0A550C9U7_9AGAR|nr:hypothetical protein BD626DRAFT_79591 [Auriculariopsis ampla]
MVSQRSRHPATDTSDAPPIPTIVGADSKLMKWLSSEGVMTGSLNKGKESVWSALERLKRPTTYGGSTQVISPDGETGKNAQEGEEGARARDDDDNASFMVYADLQPNRDSVLELADEELEYVEDSDASRPASPGGKGKDTGAVSDPKSTKGKDKEKQHKTKEIHVWVPSAEKLSVEALWWGYRIYLPPPVMQVLDDSRIAAAKKGAMVAAALKWVLDHIPTAIFPPPIRPAMMMLKRLTPYLSYVGVFVAWSWSAITARDNGNGVVLTATWLLPVALIPSPWEERVGEIGVAAPKRDGEDSPLKQDGNGKEGAPPKKAKRGRRDSATKWEEIKAKLLNTKQ